MKQIRFVKYLTVWSIPATAAVSFTSTGWLVFLPLLYVFGLLPLLELLLRPSEQNLSAAEQEMALHDRVYDWLLYAVVPVQYGFLVWFLFSVTQEGLTTADLLGRISAMGVLCGVLGINVAHELGHRSTAHEQLMSKMLLLTSLYMHFFIEHNRGHHRHVATPEDPASARYGETVYGFWLRSVWESYRSAWKLEAERLRKKQLSFWSFHNEMLWFQGWQAALVGCIGLALGWIPMFAFIGAATMGFLLLETVNYIEHYGLSRRQTEAGAYERVLPVHSWNSNHPIGRVVLFELSRHSDHHYIASRKYQVLRHHEQSPQMPTGYPGMMVLALIPPLWFTVMHAHLKRTLATA